MAASEASGTLIFFIASTVIAVAVAGGLTTAVSEVSGKIGAKGTAMSASLVTDLEIVNDPNSVITRISGNPGLIIYVKNTGQRTLVPGDLSVLVDGKYGTFTWTTTDGSAAASFVWSQGKTVNLTISDPAVATNMDHFVRVITDNGRSAEFSFYK